MQPPADSSLLDSESADPGGVDPAAERGAAGEGSPGPGSQARADRFVFSGVLVRPPLEELAETYAKRMRGLRSLEDAAIAARLGRAYEIARQRLEAALSSPGTVPPAREG
jgi:hypothetical protein